MVPNDLAPACGEGREQGQQFLDPSRCGGAAPIDAAELKVLQDAHALEDVLALRYVADAKTNDLMRRTNR